jgi:uncharacterized protein
MKCPLCETQLKPVVANGITVDVCEGGCGGIWFDQFELQRFGVPSEPAPDILLNVTRNPGLAIDTTRKRPCPRCVEVMLKRRLYNPKSLVQVDECGGCAGIWLDAGELLKIREELRDQAPENLSFDITVLHYLAALRKQGASEPPRKRQ